MNKTTNKYSPKLRESAVRMVLDSVGQHESRQVEMVSISSKIDRAPHLPNKWVKQVEDNTSERGGITIEQTEQIDALERKDVALLLPPIRDFCIRYRSR